MMGMPVSESQLLAEARIGEAWALVERFASLHRISGSADELEAAGYIGDRLAGWGVPHRIYRPRLYLSVPREASVRCRLPDGGTIEVTAKAPSFSVSTARGDEGPGWVSGPARYRPGLPAAGMADLFRPDPAPETAGPDLQGCVVLTEGFPMPARVRQLEQRGAVAAVFAGPGQRIHETICTPVWGTPDLGTAGQRPRLAVASVSHRDGLRLRDAIAQAQEVGHHLELAVRTRLDEGWYECPLPVAEIPGHRWPEEFVLLHGHLDSWHVGIGDNAVGNGAMLEVARRLWACREGLERTVRIAWWPGHSTGRYAGSTWYADHFARDIRRHCVLHINCDSPGCRGATVFRDVATMAETDSLAHGVVRDAAGLPLEGAPPERAGDLSFSNLGVSTLFMLSSSMSPEDRAARGYYAVGGCGGNIAWHTEDDTLEVADPDHLLRDIQVYLLATWRAANDRIHPLDFRATAAQLRCALSEYQQRLGPRFDLSPAWEAAAELAAALEGFYRRQVVPAGSPSAPWSQAAQVNAKLRRTGRVLVNLLYSQAGRYRQDPALPVAILPELAAAARAAEAGQVDLGFVATEVLRAQNRITGAVDDVLAVLSG